MINNNVDKQLLAAIKAMSSEVSIKRNKKGTKKIILTKKGVELLKDFNKKSNVSKKILIDIIVKPAYIYKTINEEFIKVLDLI